VNNRVHCSQTCMLFRVRIVLVSVRGKDGFGIKLSGGPNNCSQLTQSDAGNYCLPRLHFKQTESTVKMRAPV
jgi:hypothetical protein